MTVRVRPIVVAGAVFALVGYFAYTVFGDGFDAYTPIEDVAFAILSLGLGLLMLGVALRLWRVPQRPIRMTAVAPGTLAALFFTASVGSLANSLGERRDANPAGPIVSPAATSTARATLGPTPTPSSSTTPSRAAPTESPSATSTPGARTAELSDPVGDTLDDSDSPATGPAYVDIKLVTVAASSGKLVMTIAAAAAAPPRADPITEELAYGWWIEVGGDETPDWQVLVRNSLGAEASIPGWIAGISDPQGGQLREGRESFPGAVAVDANRISVTLPLAEIGNPRVVRVAAFTQDTQWLDPLTNVVRQDLAPDRQWPNGTDWITVLAE